MGNINFFLKIDLEGTDTQAGLKAFKKIDDFFLAVALYK